MLRSIMVVPKYALAVIGFAFHVSAQVGLFQQCGGLGWYACTPLDRARCSLPPNCLRTGDTNCSGGTLCNKLDDCVWLPDIPFVITKPNLIYPRLLPMPPERCYIHGLHCIAYFDDR